MITLRGIKSRFGFTLECPKKKRNKVSNPCSTSQMLFLWTYYEQIVRIQYLKKISINQYFKKSKKACWHSNSLKIIFWKRVLFDFENGMKVKQIGFFWHRCLKYKCFIDQIRTFEHGYFWWCPQNYMNRRYWKTRIEKKKFWN